jgi:P-loop containing dynein motor region D4
MASTGSTLSRVEYWPGFVHPFYSFSAEALEKVASKFLEDMDMEDEVRRNCVTMCGYFHESVRLVKTFLKRL